MSIPVNKAIPDVDPVTLRGRKGDLAVLGSTGLEHSSGYVDDEFHAALRGERGRRVWREMRDNDATIGASFNLIDNMCRQVSWRVEPYDNSAQARECAEFLESCLEDMSHTWSDTVSEILSMLWFGWASIEKVYKFRLGPSDDPTRRSRFSDGRLGWRKLPIRAQETLDRWEIEDDGGIRGWWQVAAPHYKRVFLPIEKLVLFRTTTAKGNPEGRSLLRNAYRSWFFLKRMQEIEAIGIERDLVGLPVLQLPEAYFDPRAPQAKKSALTGFSTLIKQIRRNEHEGVIIPAEVDREGNPTGYKLGLLSTGGARSLDIAGAINRYERSIAQTLFTQFLFLGMDGVGSYSLSSDITDMLVVSLNAILDNIEETFNRHATFELLSLNGYAADVHARLRHGEVTKRDMTSLASSLTALVGAGLITPDTTLEAYLRNEGKLPERIDDEEQGDAATVASTARRVLDAMQRNRIGDKDAGDVDTEAIPGDDGGDQ